MRQVKKPILFLLIAFLTSCIEKSGKSTLEIAQTLHFAEEDCQSVNERVDSVIYCPAIHGAVHPAEYRQDVFPERPDYAGDLSSRKVVAFHSDGTVAFCINRSGHGEGEYQDFKSFTVDGEHIYVVDNTRRTVLLYDSRTGAYEKQKPLPVMSWDIEAATNGEFLLTFIPNIGGCRPSPNRSAVSSSQTRISRYGKGFSSMMKTIGMPWGYRPTSPTMRSTSTSPPIGLTA